MTRSLATDEHKEAFRKNGFAVVEGVLDAALAAELRGTVLALAERERRSGAAHFYDPSAAPHDPAGPAQRVWNLLNKGKIFRELIQLPLVLDFMEHLFQRDTPHQKYLLSSFQANILRPGAPRQKLHVDTPVPEPLPPWIIKANTIWLLEDFGPTNGSTEVLPGSHRYGVKPAAEDQGRADVRTVVAPAGSVIFTHGALWHRSGANRSDRERVALLGSFAASFAREIANEEDCLQVLDPAVVESASDRLKAILGVGHGIKPGARVSPPAR